MTTPTPDSFEYNDDSVVARVSFDVPTQAVADVAQLTQAMGAMRTELEAISRAQGDWLEYLKQVPVITEQANQAYRDSITQLERMSYITNEMNGGQGNVGFQSPMRSGDPGGGGYSTAAPMGYANPFQGMVSGMGVGAGVGGMIGGMGAVGSNVKATAEYMQNMASEDPRLFANTTSARGMAVNPAMVGMLGGAVAGAMGRGNESPGAQVPQPTSSSRDSAAAPDPLQGGTPVTAEDPNIPGEPHENTPMWQKVTAMLGAKQIVAEMQGGKYGRIAKMVGGAAGKLPGLGGGGAAAAGAAKAAGGFLSSTPGKVAAGLGLGAAALNVSQDVGEKITEFQQLGAIQGGDYMTGMKYEAQARIMGLNPFISTEQARKAMQMALREGFRGESYDTVQDFMIQNFKDLGVSMDQSMRIIKMSVKGLTEDQDITGAKEKTRGTMELMNQLSAEGGQSSEQRMKSYEELQQELTGQGISQESIDRGAIGLQEGYGDSRILRDRMSSISNQVYNSDTLKAIVGYRAGITGKLPGAMGRALEKAGMDNDEVTQRAAQEVARMVSGVRDPDNRIAMFQDLMAQNGVTLNFQEAEDLYNRVTASDGKQLPTERAVERVGSGSHLSIGERIKGAGSAVGASATGLLKGGWDMITNFGNPVGMYNAAKNTINAELNADKRFYGSLIGRGGFTDQQNDFLQSRQGDFSPSGSTPRDLPKTAAQAAPASLTTQGQVTGEVRIIIDQAGRAQAPQVIQLTGTQKAALAGRGSAQLNNASPGDPIAWNPLPGGGG